MFPFARATHFILGTNVSPTATSHVANRIGITGTPIDQPDMWCWSVVFVLTNLGRDRASQLVETLVPRSQGRDLRLTVASHRLSSVAFHLLQDTHALTHHTPELMGTLLPPARGNISRDALEQNTVVRLPVL